MSGEWTGLELAKLGVSVTSPLITLGGFYFVWLQLKNTAVQIGIARESLDASNTQNAKNQDWKRAEFLAGQIREFYENETVFKVLQMLDYDARHYHIGITDQSGKPMMTKVVHGERKWPRLEGDKSYVSLEAALRVHDTDSLFTDEETIVRDFFDIFLYGIERFERFLAAELFSEKELYPYLRYYVRLLRGKLHAEGEVIEVFKKYLEAYHFIESRHLIYCRFMELQ